MSKKHSTTTRRNFKQASVATGLDILRQKYGTRFSRASPSTTAVSSVNLQMRSKRAVSTSPIRILLVNEEPMRNNTRW